MVHKRNLYIFVTSNIPDVYINTIGYCIENYNINEIVLLGIVKDKGQKAGTDKYLLSVKSHIEKQLTLLQENKYLYKDQDSKEWEEKHITIEPHHKARYLKISEYKIDIHTILYDSLENEINTFLEKNNNNCLFDVSAILKGYLIDIYTILLMNKVENIFVFELKLKSRTYDEKELIHNLYLDRHDYEYVNLTKSKYTLGTVIRSKSSVDDEKNKISKINQLLDKYTTSYAINILNWYLLFVLISFVLIIFVIVRGDWNSLEPWTFILFGLPLLSYIINLFFQIIFKKSISLKPTNIYNWLKRNKQKKVSQELQLK